MIGGTWVYKLSIVVLRSCSPWKSSSATAHPPTFITPLTTNTLLYHLTMQPFRNIQIQIVLALALAASVIAIPTPQS